MNQWILMNEEKKRIYKGAREKAIRSSPVRAGNLKKEKKKKRKFANSNEFTNK